MKGRAPPAKKIAVREESKSPMRQPKVRGKVKAEEKDEKFLGDGSSMEDAKRRGQSQVRRSSFVLREAVANATAKEVDAWMARQGAGTTVYQHRFDHKVKDYSLDASNYHMTPSIVDFPVQAINPSLHKPNTLVHIDIVSFKVSLGKIMVELFENEAPRTCANFKSLCIGDNEKGLSYSGCRFHKVIPGFMMLSGDITKGDGSGGESIYGDNFPDETFELQHVGAGILTMMNRGSADTNNSQFAILLDKADWLDGRHVVFGKIVDGVNLVKRVAEKFGTELGVPNSDIYMGHCSIE